jgi:hypothetical protein
MALRVAVASGNWSNPAIWNGGVLPTVGDVVASNNFTVTIDQNINVDTLTNAAQALVDAVPNMTSPTTPSGIVTESTTRVGWEGWKVFDGTTSLEWRPIGQQWVAYEFTTPKAIDQYYFIGDTTKNAWKFEAWDGTNWITLHSITGASVTSYTSPLLGNSTQYIKYRFFTLDSIEHRFREIDFYEYLGTTSAVAGGGFVVSGNFTVTANKLSRGSSVVLTYTGSGTVNIVVNSFTFLSTGNIIVISGNGNVNYIGSIVGYNTGSNTFIYKGGSGKLTITGDLSGQYSNAAIINLDAGSLEVTGNLTISNSSGSGSINCLISISGNNTSCLITGTMLNNSTVTNFVGPIQNNPNCIYTAVITNVKHIGSQQNSSNSGFCVTSTSASAINIFTGPFISSPSGMLPLYVTRMHYQRTLGSYYEFRDNSTNGALPPAGPAPITRLVSPGTPIDAPAVSNVRQGVVYAAGSLTGTMVVPAASNVANNVLVDNTVGTAVLDPNAIWAVPLTSINTLNSIGRRVKNAATVETTGAQIQTTLNNNE